MDAAVVARIHAGVKARNLVETQPYEGILLSYGQLLASTAKLGRDNKTLQAKLVIARHEASEAMAAEGQTSGLQRRVNDLQEELAVKYKKDAEEANTKLELTTQVLTLKGQLEESTTLVATLKASLVAAQEREADLSAKVTDLMSDNELMRVEVESLRDMLTKAEERARAAEAENVALVDRIVKEKDAAAAQINEMNALVELLQNQLKVRDNAEAAGVGVGDGGDPASAASAASVLSTPSTYHGMLQSLPSSVRVRVPPPGGDASCNAVRFGDVDRTFLVGFSDGGIKVFDNATGDEKRVLHAPGAALGLDTCGEWVLAGLGDKSVGLWSMKSGRLRQRLLGHGGVVHAVRFCHGGRGCVSGGADRCLRIWDISRPTYACRHTLRGGSTVLGIDLEGGSGSLALSAHRDGKVRFWDVGSGVGSGLEATEVFSGPANSVEVSPTNSFLAVVAGAGEAAVIDIRMNSVVNRFSMPGGAAAAGANATWSPSGELVALGSGGTAAIWDAMDGTLKASLEATGIVTGVAWAQGGFVTCLQGGGVLMWS